MATEFNPYHVWLGIPPEELPANYYRLLGLRVFESNGDVIDSAADRQMAHLRTFQGGKHTDLTQRLLNEVSAARVCLLDAKKRAAYDQLLRAKLPAATPSALPAAAPTATSAGIPTSAGQAVAGGSAIYRQVPRRTTDTLPTALPTAAPLQAAQAATPQPTDAWDDLLGDATVKPGSGGKVAKKAGAKATTAQLAAAKQKASSRIVSIGITVAVVLVAAIGIGLFATGGGSSDDGKLTFDWPAADRADATLTVDNTQVTIPANGPWDFGCPAGSHRVVAQRPAYKFAADVSVAAGQEQAVAAPVWQPKAVLLLSWPLEIRGGAELKIDGRVQTVTQQMPLEIPVEPGQHSIRITRADSAPIETSASVAPDGRESVAIAPPPTTATLALDWPADERKDAELTIDGHTQAAPGDADANPFPLSVEPGKHVVRITRAGFESFSQSIEISAGATQPIKPSWTPEQKEAAPAVVEKTTPVVETASQPAKKLAPPSAAEQEQIAKQIDDRYKTSRAGSKDAAKAQELYDVAAKAESSPGERYVLLMKGAEIAAAAGDLNLSLSGIDTLGAAYDIAALEVKQKLVDKFIAAARADQVEAAIPVAEQLVDQAVAADHYETALMLSTAASRAVVKSQSAERKEIEARLARRRHDIRLIGPIYAAAEKAEAVLEQTPADPAANLLVGRWRCFFKSDWTGGLPLLAKGSDEKLKSLADAELKPANGADGQVQLADAWWELAQREAGAARDSLRLHAGDIYQAALPDVSSALKKAAIEKRMTEIADLRAATANAVTNAPSSLVRFPLMQWVDVLRLVDTSRNVVKGDWSRTGKEVDILPSRGARIAMPVAVHGSYDLEVMFSRRQEYGDVRVMIPVGSHACCVVLGAYRYICGLDAIDGHDVNTNQNPTKLVSHDLENGRAYRLLIKVRVLNAERARIDVFMDGRLFLPHWEGNPAQLSVPSYWAMPAGDHLGLAAYSASVAFGGARLRMVSGGAETDASMANSGSLASASTPSSASSSASSSQSPSTVADASMPAGARRLPFKQAIDLLPLVDIKKNTVEGKWSRNGKELDVESGLHPRIVIPVAIEGSYDLELEFNRLAGKGEVRIQLPVGSHACDLEWGYDGSDCDLSLLDGQHLDGNPTRTTVPDLQNGHPYHFLIKVRLRGSNLEQATVDVLVENKPLIPHWEGRQADFSVDRWWKMPTDNHLGLGAWKSQVAFSSARLRVYSGQAWTDSSVELPAK